MLFIYIIFAILKYVYIIKRIYIYITRIRLNKVPLDIRQTEQSSCHPIWHYLYDSFKPTIVSGWWRIYQLSNYFLYCLQDVEGFPSEALAAPLCLLCFSLRLTSQSSNRSPDRLLSLFLASQSRLSIPTQQLLQWHRHLVWFYFILIFSYFLCSLFAFRFGSNVLGLVDLK